jgi:hypothetical protein
MWPNGDVYTGENIYLRFYSFKQNLNLKKPKNKLNKGEYNDGYKTGKGVYKYANGEIYDGIFNAFF